MHLKFYRSSLDLFGKETATINLDDAEIHFCGNCSLLLPLVHSSDKKRNTVEALVTDTLVSGQLALPATSQNPVLSTPIQILYFYLPESGQVHYEQLFFAFRGCPLTRASTVLQETIATTIFKAIVVTIRNNVAKTKVAKL